MKRHILVLAALLAALWAAPALAQDQPPDSQNKLLAERAAKVDAYRNLAETIKGFQIDSTTKVKDFVTESDEINTAFATFIKGVQPVGEPRHYDDGSCEVDVQVTIEEIVTTLKTIVQRHYKGNRYTDTTFDKLVTTVTTKVVKATGAGAPRMAKPETEESNFISPPPPSNTRKLNVPDNWKGVPAAQRLGAERAAKTDAERNLAEMIKGLRIDSQTHVKDFVTESDEINTAMGTFLKGVQKMDTRYSPTDLIVEVDVEMQIDEIITYLKTIVQRHYKGSRFTDKTIEQIQTETTRKVYRATGKGTVGGGTSTPAPAPPAPPAPPAAKDDTPEWAKKTVKAVGHGAPKEGDSEAKAKLNAERAALTEARRNLLEQLKGVSIDSKTTVRDFVTESDEIKTKTDGFIQGAKTIRSEQLEDGSWEVEIEISLADFYNNVYKKFRK
jgi:hypothetical protein